MTSGEKPRYPRLDTKRRDEFETQLDKKFAKYVPSLAPDHALLSIAAAYFHDRSPVDNAITSYEQSFDAIQRMLPTQFRHVIRGLSSNGDKVEVEFWYDHLEYTAPHVMQPDQPALPPTPMLAMQTGSTYACYVTADFHARLTRVETTEERQGKLKAQVRSFLSQSPNSSLPLVKSKGRRAITSALLPDGEESERSPIEPQEKSVAEDQERSMVRQTPGAVIDGGKKREQVENVVARSENPNVLEVHKERALRSSFPIMVGTKWCQTQALRKSPGEAWRLGEDPNDPGGYIILDGKAITCGSVYTHTPNFPMSMHSQRKDIEVYVTIMTRRDPFFGNTYQLVPAITQKKVLLPGKQSMTQYDIVIEIVWNTPDMNPKEVGSVKAHLSRVPIFALFCYYGCDTNADMCNYIFPGVDESDARVRMLVEAVTMGPYHRLLYDKAHPITPHSALLHIGECILSSEAKKRYKAEIAADMEVIARDMNLDKTTGSSASSSGGQGARQYDQVLTYLYEERVRSKAKDILDGTFFFNVNHDPRKVCLSMGTIISHMINVHLLREGPTDRTNLGSNRIQPIGEQFTGEAKKYIKKELIDPTVRRLNDHFFGRYTWEGMKSSFQFEVTASLSDAGSRLATKLKRAFKSSTKAQGQQPRLLEEVYDPKNIIFIWSKINEVTIRPSVGEKGSTITYIRRQVHPSHAMFICGVQTPEAGADVGRYHQPTIYATLSKCEMETYIRTLLEMENKEHPSPNPRLESGAVSSEEPAIEEA